MKRYWTIALTALTVFLVAVAAWKMWPRTVPLEECSEIYQHYHDNPHVVASFLKDFRVNDTVTVDVTLLEAKDDEGWEELRERFDIGDLSDMPEDVRHLFEKDQKSAGVFQYAEEGERKKLAVYSREKRSVAVFHTEEKNKIDAIYTKEIREITH